MELTSGHREALIDKLKDTVAELDSRRTHLNNMPKEDQPTVPWVEMDVFLLQERQKLIEKSLVDNDIDF